MLDAIVSPEWEYRYYSFKSHWDDKRHERMASMRNGSGDDYFILFQPDGAILKGFAHESPVAAVGAPTAGLFEGVPATFGGFLREPAFSMDCASFCLWNLGDGWRCGTAKLPKGDDPDGSAHLLGILSGNPADYARYAAEYFEVEVAVDAVARVYRHEPLTPALVTALNPSLEMKVLSGDMKEIGYPAGAPTR
jgi:hypothetical protein